MLPRTTERAPLTRLFDDMFEGMQLWPESVPLRERVLNRLADLMLCADDVLDMLRTEPASQLRICEKPVRRVYESINSLMKRLCD